MTIKVGINGLGRIGRMVFRAAMQDPSIEIVAVNATTDSASLVHLLKYDSIHGRWDAVFEAEENALILNGRRIAFMSDRDINNLKWGDYGVDVVVESTGKFRSKDTAGVHLKNGAKKVIITAPGKDEDITVVMGVNEEMYDPDQHHVISNASCTTNCLAPVVKVLHQAFTVEQGMMTTIHSYTNDQKNLDNPHKDLRRARACGQSIIPTSTGAAKAVALVLPELSGKLNGLSLRVPTPNVSIVDFVATLRQEVTAEQVNDALREAAQGKLNGILDFTEEPLVSVDFIGHSASSIIDGLSTMVVGDRQVKVLAWYDNEWGYSKRVVDLARFVGSKTQQKQAVLAK
jgi:glyceraldehyde 3-phosphate dehydrogenase